MSRLYSDSIGTQQVRAEYFVALVVNSNFDGGAVFTDTHIGIPASGVGEFHAIVQGLLTHFRSMRCSPKWGQASREERSLVIPNKH